MKNVIMTILAMLVLGLGGYLVYDKVIDKDNENVNNEVVENNQEETIEKENTYQVLNSLSFIAVLYNGEVYVNAHGSSPELVELYGDQVFQTLVNTRNNYQEYNFDELKVLDSMNKNFKGMKLNIYDVKAIYEYSHAYGTRKDDGIFIIKNDGTVYGISHYSLIKGKRDMTAITGLNNIVEFASDSIDVSITYAVDSTGNKYNMNDYVPQDYNQW